VFTDKYQKGRRCIDRRIHYLNQLILEALLVFGSHLTIKTCAIRNRTLQGHGLLRQLQLQASEQNNAENLLVIGDYLTLSFATQIPILIHKWIYAFSLTWRH